MSALIFVDTPVHLYSKDARDAAKQIRANEWLTWCWTRRTGRISTQVLNEFYNNAITRFGKAVFTTASIPICGNRVCHSFFVRASITAFSAPPSFNLYISHS